MGKGIPENTLPLWAEPAELAAPATDAPAVEPTRPQLWLCLQLPELPLEVLSDASRAQPLAVVEEQDRRRRLVSVNAAAARAGLCIGLELRAAYALLPQLAALSRNPWCEQRALQRLARRCRRYTPAVCIEPPSAMLLEVAASLRLFGGLRKLTAELVAAVEALGHRVYTANAPTPLAALWLARSRALEDRPAAMPEEIEGRQLAGRLGELPVACLGWPEETMRLLEQLGLRQLRDCLRLPRDGFARRFGAERLAELDRGLGRRADPRSPYAPPQRYEASLALPHEIEDAVRLLDASGRLLQPLARLLRSSQRGVQRLQLLCHHRSRTATALEIGLLEPSSDPAHLQRLLAERLEHLELPAPVSALSLRIGELPVIEPVSEALFADMRRERARIPQLLERLRARLGIAAVHGLRQVAEHRPELAWRTCEPLPRGRPPPAVGADADGLRPFWIFSEPVLLVEQAGHPCYDGRLQLEYGPERIETGWWDDAHVRRDYYIASNACGVRLWIYREHRPPHHWFAHGAFG